MVSDATNKPSLWPRTLDLLEALHFSNQRDKAECRLTQTLTLSQTFSVGVRRQGSQAQFCGQIEDGRSFGAMSELSWKFFGRSEDKNSKRTKER